MKEIFENFSILDDWQDKYSYIIELGKKLETFPDHLKIPENKVTSCLSETYVTKSLGYSESQIVSGIIYIIFEISKAGLNHNETFKQLEIETHLTKSRANAIWKIIEKIG